MFEKQKQLFVWCWVGLDTNHVIHQVLQPWAMNFSWRLIRYSGVCILDAVCFLFLSVRVFLWESQILNCFICSAAFFMDGWLTKISLWCLPCGTSGGRFFHSSIGKQFRFVSPALFMLCVHCPRPWNHGSSSAWVEFCDHRRVTLHSD
jgi:hypothetical protein